MGKFQYRMQGILEIKFKMENLAKQNFAAATARVNEEEQRLEELKKRKEEYEENARILLKDNLSVQCILENNNAILRMEEYIQEQENRLLQARENLDQERERLSEAVKERKIHENLRNKEFDEFIMDENKSESKSNDELTSYRYGHQK